MQTEIVRIGPAQARLLEGVADDLFDEAIDPKRVAAYLAEPNHLMVLALSGGEVIGQARGMVHRHPDLPTELYIDNLGVADHRRREGVATRMLDERLGSRQGLRGGLGRHRGGQRPGPDAVRTAGVGGGDVRAVFLRVLDGLSFPRLRGKAARSSAGASRRWGESSAS